MKEDVDLTEGTGLQVKMALGDAGVKGHFDGKHVRVDKKHVKKAEKALKGNVYHRGKAPTVLAHEEREGLPTREYIKKSWRDRAMKKKAELTKKVSHPGYEEFSTEDNLREKAEKSGVSYGILKQVFERGTSAWKIGHRPGTTPEQYGESRVNSFLTGGKTRRSSDIDLWEKCKSKKHRKEETDTNYAFDKWNALSESDVVVDTPTGTYVKKGSVATAKTQAQKKFRDLRDKQKITTRIAKPIERRYLQRKDEE